MNRTNNCPEANFLIYKLQRFIQHANTPKFCTQNLRKQRRIATFEMQMKVWNSRH